MTVLILKDKSDGTIYLQLVYDENDKEWHVHVLSNEMILEIG